MDKCSADVVLITGGNGFLGQHVVRELQLKDSHNLKEIRILDLVPYCNKFQTSHSYSIPVVSFVASICDKESSRDAFKGVSCVMHLAAFIDYSIPADLGKLDQFNVKGTQNVIELCKEENVPILLHCSTAEVTLRPRLGPFPVIIGLTEHGANPPYSTDVLPPYVVSKLKAENLVLAENMSFLNNGKERLRVVALRPTFLFGELENRMLPAAVKVASWTKGALIELQGPGGPGCKLQFTYAGNAAWAFVRAKEALKLEPTENPSLSACGLPVFVTDYCMVQHPLELAAQLLGPSLAHKSSLWLPLSFTYPAAVVLEKVAQCLGVRLPLQPTGLVKMLACAVYFNGLRAAICLDYTPPYSQDEAVQNTRFYFEDLYSTHKQS